MLKFLNKPYPFNDDLRYNAKIILFISLGILAFILLFRPINIKEFTSREIFYLVTGIAISTFLVLSLNLLIIPSLIPKAFHANVWTIKREIFWNLWILLAISGSDFLFYTKLLGVIDINFYDIVKIVLLGLLPVAVLITINQTRLLRLHLKTAQLLNEKLSAARNKTERFIDFNSDYKKDNLRIKPSALILIKSADNYVEVFYRSEGIIKRQMVRTSLTRVEENLREFDSIIKCHRTFIVNVDYITEVRGNSQGFKLYFEDIDFPALVSQQYIKEFNKML